MSSDGDRRATRWRRFAEACRDRSPLYGRLALAIADDEQIAGLLDVAPTRELGHPTLLFAAVHDLLLAGTTDADELAAHYPSLGDHPVSGPPRPGDAWPAFRAFCLEHRAPIESRIRTRRTQTNEVGRATALLVALRDVHRDVGRPLGWLDVGTSAGLTLRLDRFHHDLGDGRGLGDPSSPVKLHCAIEGDAPTDAMPAVAWRAGLDASPLDVSDPADRRWLEACVWPEQTDRLARLRAALSIGSQVPVPITAGDAVDDLARACRDVPADVHLVVSHTWVLAYLSPERRTRFEATLDEIGASRDLDRIGMEGAGALPGTERGDPSSPSLLLRTRVRDGDRTDTIVADLDDHGRWLTWRT